MFNLLKTFFSFLFLSNNIEHSSSSHKEDVQYFYSKQDAIDWLYNTVNDHCINNIRFAYFDNQQELNEYYKLRSEGCCGFFDQKILVNGKLAIIGCNYGH